MKTTLYDLYRGPLTVWVEDAATHAVLTELWSDPKINVLVSDGKPGVTHMVNASPRERHVYGVVDRDFDDDNADGWEAPGCRVLRLPAHELEQRLNQAAGRGQALEVMREAFQRHLETDEWLLTFSGKELLRFQRSHVPGLDRTPTRPPRPTQQDRDLNMAKEIVRKMRELGRAPAPLGRLRDVLRAKAGLI